MIHFQGSVKLLALTTCGGVFWVLGAGSCLPQNFWPGLLGDTILTGITSAFLTAALTAAGL